MKLQDFHVDPLVQEEEVPRAFRRKDAQGAVVHVRLPTGVEREVDKLIQRARECGFPWETRQDFIREAVDRLIQTMSARFENEDDTLRAMRAEKDYRDRAEWLSQLTMLAENTLRSVVDVVRKKLMLGLAQEAAAEVSKFESMMSNIQDPFQRAIYQQAATRNPEYQTLKEALL